MADECKISDQDGPEDLEEVMEVDKEAEKESDSDDDESSDDEGKNEKRISELNLQIEQNPYIYDSYIELMKLLREDGELDKLRATREKMSEIFPLTEDLWLDWIEDEKKFAESEAEREKVERLFQRATKDYMSVGVWLEYANFSIGDLGNSGGMEKIRDVFQQALIACGLHVTKGASLWDAYRDFENAVLGGLQPAPGRIQTKEEQEKFESQMKRITNLFKRQLSLPLKQIETTYVEYQDWITEEEDPSIKAAYNKSKEKLQQIMPMENKLEIARNGTLEIYQDYIDHELKADEPARIQCIFERALQEHCLVPDMWAQYTKYLDRQLRIPDVVLSVHERATRNCPWAVAVWLGYVRAMERFQQDHQKIKQTFDKAMNAGFTQGCDYLQLWSAYCDYLRRRINWDQDHQSELEDLRATFDKAINHLLEFFPEDGDPNCTLLQYWARIEAKFCHNMEKVRELWNQVMQAGFGNQASMWLEYFNLERAYGDHKHCRKILQRACNSVNDWPETVCETYIRFEQEEGTLEQYDIAIQRTEAQLARIQERRQKPKAKEVAVKTLAEGICPEFLQGACSSNNCQQHHLPEDIMFCDAHCHLDRLLNQEKLTFCNILLPRNFACAITNFIDPNYYEFVDEILKEDLVYGTLGVHPQHASKLTQELQNEVEILHENKKILAVGETGLDAIHAKHTSLEDQTEAFIFHINLAKAIEKPLVFHCREKHEDMLEIAQNMVPPSHRIHLHCFIGNISQAKQWMDSFPNLKIGITNLIHSKSMKSLHKAVAEIPLDRLLLETDAPYMFPSNLKREYPHRFTHPGMALNVAVGIAKLKNLDICDVLNVTTRNCAYIYGLSHFQYLTPR